MIEPTIRPCHECCGAKRVRGRTCQVCKGYGTLIDCPTCYGRRSVDSGSIGGPPGGSTACPTCRHLCGRVNDPAQRAARIEAAMVNSAYEHGPRYTFDTRPEEPDRFRRRREEAARLKRDGPALPGMDGRP